MPIKACLGGFFMFYGVGRVNSWRFLRVDNVCLLLSKQAERSARLSFLIR